MEKHASVSRVRPHYPSTHLDNVGQDHCQLVVGCILDLSLECGLMCARALPSQLQALHGAENVLTEMVE